MKTWLIVVIATLAILAGGTGYLALNFEKPEFGVIDRGEWTDVNEESIEVTTSIWVKNPNPIGLPLGFVGVGYAAETNEETLAEGEIEGLGIGTGNNTKKFRTEIIQDNIPDWWANHLKRGEKTTFKAPVSVKFPFGQFSREIFSKNISTDITGRIEESLGSLEGEYTGPEIEREVNGFKVVENPEMEVREFKTSWGNVTKEKSEILMDITLYNPNSYPVPAPSFDGEARLNNITVSNWTANPQALTELTEEGMIPPKEEEIVRFKASLMNEKMDEWFESHVKRDEYTEGKIEADLIFQIEGREFSVPAGGLRCEMNIQTAVLVDGEEQNFEKEGCEPVKESYAGQEDLGTDESGGSSTESQSDGDELVRENLLN